METSDFLGESSVADAPDWFRVDADKKAIASYLREQHERLTSDNLLVVYRGGDHTVTAKSLNLLVHNRGLELLSDEAVESIGKEDYVRMVACIGKFSTNRYFEKRSGLEDAEDHPY
jgi:hypothetical protein